MKHDLAEKWRERLLILQAQLERETGDMMTWHWRSEARVLQFLLRRYGETCGESNAPGDAATAGVAASSGAELSPLERALLRMSLLIPNIHTKHLRPSPRDRAAILERIKIAGEQARELDEADESWSGIPTQLHKKQMEASAYRDLLAHRFRLREAELKRLQREKRRR